MATATTDRDARRARLDSLRAEFRQVESEILDNLDTDNFTQARADRGAELQRRASAIKDDIDALEDEMRAEIVSLASDPRNVVQTCANETRGPELLRKVEPWRDGTDSRSRARKVLEIMERSDELADTDAERAEGLVRSDEGRDDADLICVGSNPDYRTAFRKMLRHGQDYLATFTPEEQRAWSDAMQYQSRAAVQTGNTGQYLIPTHLDPTIRITNTGSINPFRQIASNYTLNNASAWHGVTSAGVTGEWVSEAAEVTDATPTFSPVTLTPLSADIYAEASWEAVDDSSFDAQLGTLLQDGKDRLEATAFSTGNGTTEPLGVVTALGQVTASRVSATTNAAFGVVDIYALARSLPDRYQPNAKWVANTRWEFSIREFAQGSGPQSAFWADLGSGTPPSLLGRPFVGCSGMQAPPLSSATASSDDILIYSDWSQFYAVIDRMGASLTTNRWVIGSNRRPTKVQGFLFYWRTTGGVLNSDAARLLRA